MRHIVISAFLVMVLLLSGSHAFAQDKQDKDKQDHADKHDTVAAPEGPPVRVKIVFSEYDGDKKVKSLPYTLLVRQPHGEVSWSKIRMGSRVPVATGGEKGSFNFQYIDVGTNIDCRASQAADGRYRLSLMMERSWVEGDVPFPEHRPSSSNEAHVGDFHEPVIRQFRSDSEVIVRDGQTLETNFATDPVSGKIIKLEVTLDVTK